MSYNILGISISHNSSICVLSDGKIDFFLEEDRLSRIKKDFTPSEIIRYVSSKYKINEIAIGGIQHFPNFSIFANENQTIVGSDGILNVNDETFPFKDFWFRLLRKYFGTNIKITDYRNRHHLLHAYHSFTNSGFLNAVSIVLDGGGTMYQKGRKLYFETDSIYHMSKNKYKELSKSYRIADPDNKEYQKINLCILYEIINQYLGFNSLDSGKTMGLSAYGNENNQIPKLLKNFKSNPDVFKPLTWDVFFNTSYDHVINDTIVKEKYKPIFKNKNLLKDLAYRIQKDCEIETKNLIKDIIKKTNTKNICCSGGFFLNCVNNYKLEKEFPDINFYFEPISHDAGQSIGAAQLLWGKKNDKKSKLQDTLYYGPKYSKKELLKKINEHLD